MGLEALEALEDREGSNFAGSLPMRVIVDLPELRNGCPSNLTFHFGITAAEHLEQLSMEAQHDDLTNIQ